MTSDINKCDKCGEIVSDIDAGFSPAVQGMTHECGGTWRRPALPKTRTITLTDRGPVKIREDQWPEIASASERPGSFVNGTPKPDYETDCYTLRVRQHADGRAIVYGVVDASTAWTGTEGWRGGELLEAGADIAAAISRVGAGMPPSVVRECVADLPAVEL